VNPFQINAVRVRDYEEMSGSATDRVPGLVPCQLRKVA